MTFPARAPGYVLRMTTVPDALEFLHEQHVEVDRLFAELEGLQVTATEHHDVDLRDERNVVKNTVITKLSQHAAVEELHFYPAVREYVDGGDPLAERAYDEQQDHKELLHLLEDMSPGSVEFDPTLRKLIARVREHVQYEEEQVFPAIRDAVDADRLREIGIALAEAMPSAPTHPHAATPVTTLTAKAGGLMDKVRDAVEGRTTR